MKELKNGKVIKQYISYPSMMRKQIKKHPLFLQPLFEAFSNALEALTGEDDTIIVRIKFAKNSLYNENDLSFVSMEVNDNGCGFNQENYERFLNLFDESKDQNNFGTGRIQYLHFFEHTEINSVYVEEGKLKKRRIVLSSKFYDKQGGVVWSGEPEVAGENETTGTSVEFFLPYDDEDKKRYSELTSQEVRDRIFIRYLGRFCMAKNNLPNITIEKYVNNIHVDIEDRRILSSEIPDSDYKDEFHLNYKVVKEDGEGFDTLSQKERFEINAFLLSKTVQRKNEVKFTSKDETVDVSNINFEVVNRLSNIEGKHMLCLISSPYITRQDSDERGKIKIFTKAEYLKKRNLWNSHQPMIFVDDIQEEVGKKIINHYPQIKKLNDEIDKDLNEVIELFSMDKEVIDKMGSVTGESTDDFISRYTQYNAEVEAKGKTKIKSVLDSLKELDPTTKDFKKEFSNRARVITKMIPDQNRANVARYIAERKSAMVILKRIIDKQLDAQQHLEPNKRKKDEKIIHNLLFKQKTDTPIESNLWMLNEDFIHFKGTSESELKKVKIDGTDFLRDLTDEEEEQLTKYNRDYLGNRLDILLFPKEHRCIIIELKSLDADVSKFTTQATRYASLIRKFSKKEYEITNFYAYLIGESFDFEAVIDADPDFIGSPNLDYVFKPHQNVNGGSGEKARALGSMYIEVLKYSTLLERAKLRNKAFVEPLFENVLENPMEDIG